MITYFSARFNPLIRKSGNGGGNFVDWCTLSREDGGVYGDGIGG